jgi:hypothetical protein
MVLPFSISYDHLKRNPRLVDVFVYFFGQEAKAGYYSEMQGSKHSETGERKNITAKFGRVKRIVRLMLVNIGSYPGNKPADPKQLANWQENLLKLGKQAECNLYAQIDRDKSIPFEKFNVSSVLTSRAICTAMLHSMKLPSDTPAYEMQFFNS